MGRHVMTIEAWKEVEVNLSDLKVANWFFKKKINQMIKDLYVFINGIKIYLSPLHPV